MTPFYFGDSLSPRYGVLHEPSGGAFKSKAILLCGPIGHEVFRAHRMLCLLAQQLADQGFYVMRFDFAGNGDSAGDFAQQNVATWQQDIALAAEELKLAAGVELVDCVALRLAALLVLSDAAAASFGQIILWDPVADGDQFLQDLANLQREVLQDCWQFGQPRAEQELETNELLGYIYAPALREQLSALRPNASTSQRVRKVLCTEAALSAPWQHMAERCELVTEDEGLWLHAREVERSISTHGINRLIQEAV